MENGAQSRLKEWLASGQAKLHPLSFPQRELWETAPVPPGDAGNNIASLIDIRGPLTFEMCREALQIVVDRQEAMRTSFLPGRERPLQLVRSQGGELALTCREMPGPGSAPEVLLEMLSDGFSRPFDLVSGPLYRLEMLRCGPDRSVLGFTTHHAVSDGWSVSAFVEDLCTACIVNWRESGKDMSRLRGMRDTLPPVATTYSSWAAAERAAWPDAEIASKAAYWQERLRGAGFLLAGRGPAADPPGTRIARVIDTLPAAATAAVKDLARKAGATLFSTMQTAFRIALFRWLGAEDAVLGAPVAGRAKAGLRETMGYFSATLPLRTRIDPAKSHLGNIRTVHAGTMDDFAHAMPFAELVAAIEGGGRRGRHAVFDVRFAVQNHPFPSLDIPGVSVGLRVVSSGTSRFDMACEVTENGAELDVLWLYRPSVLTEEELGEVRLLFRETVADMVRSPDDPPAR